MLCKLSATEIYTEFETWQLSLPLIKAKWNGTSKKEGSRCHVEVVQGEGGEGEGGDIPLPTITLRAMAVLVVVKEVV